MSESGKNPRPTADPSVDWAEKLKASMEQEPSERDNVLDREPAPATEEDDLAALLRAQLQMNAPTPTPDLPDTDEFEEESEEDLEDEFEDEPEEDLEDEFEDESEEDLEDEFEDEPEEDLEDEFEDEPEEDLEDEFEDESVEDLEDEFEDESEEDLEDEFEDESEEDLEDEIEDDPDIAPWDEPVAEVAMSPITDDLLNGTTAEKEALQDRLQELDEFNTDILLQTGGISQSDDLPDLYQLAMRAPMDDSMTDGEGFSLDTAELDLLSALDPDDRSYDQAVDDLDEEDEEDSRQDDGVAPFAHDPLQLGLEDDVPSSLPSYEDEPEEVTRPTATDLLDAEMPVGSRTHHERMVRQAPGVASPKSTPPPQPAPANYTAQMAVPGGEAERERDTDLYLHLGYESKLRRTEEQERVERVRRRNAAPVRPRNESVVSLKDGREYTDRAQTDEAEEAYRRARGTRWLRLFIALAGTLVALFYELLPLLNVSYDLVDFTRSPLYAIVGTVWTALVLLPFIPRLLRAVRSLLDFEPTRYAIPTLALLISLAHGVIACLVKPGSLPLFGGVALFMLTVAALSECLSTEGEHRAFAVVSSGKTAYILTDEQTPASADTDVENATADRVLTVVNTGRVSDHFTRCGRYHPYMARLNYLLPVCLLVAILCGSLGVILGKDPLVSGALAFTAAYLTCLPAAYLISMFLPLPVVNTLMAPRGAAVIGAAAPADYAGQGKTRTVFRDGDALMAYNRKEITLRDDPCAAEWRRKASVVFSALSSPLAVEAPILDLEAEHIRVEIAERGEQYIKLYYIDDGRREATEIMMGTHEALVRRGIRLPKETMEKMYKKSENSRVVYLAFDRRFAIAYAAEYRVTRAFALTAARLSELGHTLSVMSYDPLVTKDLFDSSALLNDIPVDLVYPDYLETVRDTRSAGIVATGRSTDLVHPMTACHRMRTVYRRGHLVAWLSLAVGAALAVTLVLLSKTALFTSAALLLWQLLTGLVAAAVTLWPLFRK